MEKIKSFINETLQSDKGKDILIVIIIILVGLGCFELGRLSKGNDSGGIKITTTPTDTSSNIDQGIQQSINPGVSQTANVLGAADLSLQAGFQNSNSIKKTFFASSKGKKYYTISCSAGKTIKQENRIYFTTGEEAEQAGYTLSSSCN
jgi:hypothetical protein